LLASQQLLAEEEQEQAQAAAKKAKKQKAKAKKQQPQVEQPQPPPEAPSEPDSDSDQLSSEAYITTTAAAAFAGSVAPLDTDNVFSASTDFDLSTTLAPAAAPRWVGTQRLSKHGSNAETNEAVSPDSVLTASGKPKSEQLPHSERSVTAESSSSSSAAGSVRSDKTDQKVMDLFLCPITQVGSCFSLAPCELLSVGKKQLFASCHGMLELNLVSYLQTRQSCGAHSYCVSVLVDWPAVLTPTSV